MGAALMESAVAGVLSACATLLITTFRAGALAARTQTRLDDHERRIGHLEGMTEAIQSIDRRLARIEGALGVEPARRSE